MTKYYLHAALTAVLLGAFHCACRAQVAPLPPLSPDASGPTAPAVPPTAATTPAPAGSALPGQNIYNGEPIGSSTVTVSSWGGGTAAQDDTHAVDNDQHSVLIESPGFYEGGAINFSTPIDLGNPIDKTRYLVAKVLISPNPKYTAPAAPDANAQPPQNTSYAPKDNMFKLAQMPTPGENGGQMQPGQGAAAPNPDDQAPPSLATDRLHFILTLADGSQTDVVREITTPDDPSDWVSVGIPLCVLRLPPATNDVKLAAMIVCAATPADVNVGRVQIVSDSSPITADAGGDKDITVNELTTFKAHANAGASTLKYQWDFDTKNSFAEQGDGARASHTYTTPGAYNVTLIVSDVDRIKAPVTATTTVHVEE